VATPGLRLRPQTDLGREPTIVAGQNYELSLPDVPPSLNAVGSRGKSHWAYTNAKKKWEGMFFIALLEAKVPKDLLTVEAEAVLTFPAARRRDEGNYRMMLEKALGDILVTGGWICDDIPEFYAFNRLSFDDQLGPKHTLVKLTVNE
jgi:hypothetical protein